MVAADEASSRDREVLGNSDPDPTLKLPGVKLTPVGASGVNYLDQHRHKTPSTCKPQPLTHRDPLNATRSRTNRVCQHSTKGKLPCATPQLN